MTITDIVLKSAATLQYTSILTWDTDRRISAHRAENRPLAACPESAEDLAGQ